MKNHYLALLFCAGGVTFSVVNDLINPREEGGEVQGGFDTRALIGDIMVLSSAFLFSV